MTVRDVQARAKTTNSTGMKNKTVFSPKERPQKAYRATLAQILAVSVKNVLLISFGMTLGFPTILIPGLSGPNPGECFSLNQEAISWIGSINLICVPVGCMVSGAVTQPIGRRRSMQLVNIPFILAWITFRFANEVWQIYVALCLTGLTGGLLEAPVITYVAEITQPNLRGILSSTSSMSVIVGILIQFLLGTFLTWRNVAAISCAFPVVAFVLLFFIPESPHWLISKKKLQDAKKSIAWLRGWTTLEQVDPEFKELCKYIEDSKQFGVSKTPGAAKPRRSRLDTLKLFFKKSFIWPYSLVSFAFFLGHFGGMTTLQTFAVQIFASLHAPIDKYYATVILGVAEVIGCIICVFLVHVLGKRKLNFISIIGCGICFAIVATYAYSIDVKYIIHNEKAANTTDVNGTTNKSHSYSWIPLVFLVGSALVSHAGIRVLPWILTGEVYSNETRAAASGLSGAIGYVFGFLANKTFLSMVNGLTLYGTFWTNSAVMFLGSALLYFVLPETEGKTLHEITDHFAGRKKLDNKVKKKKKKPRLTNKDEGGNDNPCFNPGEVQKNFDTRL